ncbi:hypothetical protein [Bradyrhizobium manausense]|uniref:hypothetical protein n=1 Tax=Bradyrhizobium TaxID=374 RepID=UPI001BA53D24|nr:hypothetical protein [Bradyrhizobium manausense]MBR0789887.1 hypothetical protein [Bradyrhizobium manausense]
MPKRIPLTEAKKGPLGEKEDWYVLVIEDSGESYIEHEWSHENAFGKGGNAGKKKIPVDEYLKGNHNAEAVAKVKQALGRK